MFDFLTPYLDMYRTERVRLKPMPIVLHQKTCPDCGRKLVNLYYSGQLDRYICKKCVDKLMNEEGGDDNA